MKKKYEEPAIYSESVLTTFVGACCTGGTWTTPGGGMNDMFPGFCDNCTYVGGGPYAAG